MPAAASQPYKCSRNWSQLSADHRSIASKDSIAHASPVTLTADVARSYALTLRVPSSLGETTAWIGGLLAVFIPLCVWRYRRMS
jgi:hypothetical protein